MNDPGYERTAFVPDLHAPHINEQAFSCAIAFLRLFKPHHVFIMGDVVDFYQVSRFNKDPLRLNGLQEDLDAGNAALKRIRQACPRDAKMVMLEGNHEARITKFLRSTAPVLESIRNLQVPELLSLGEFDIDYVPSGVTRHHGFIVKHGNIVSNKSGYTAYREMDKAGISGISAHTHRLGQVYRTNYGGMYTWVEAGCLCDDDPEYISGVADWQHGMAYGYWRTGDERFTVHTLPIINGRAVYGGREVGAPRVKK